jgi:hypothetical protein
MLEYVRNMDLCKYTYIHPTGAEVTLVTFIRNTSGSNLVRGSDYTETFRGFNVKLRISPRWVRGNIGSTDARETCHILNAYIFETNNHKVIINTSLDSL